jgi:hypothetical protein
VVNIVHLLPNSERNASAFARFRVPPMGKLPGYDEATGGGTTREYHAPTIPPGAGPAVADRLKGAGVDLPPAVDAKIRGGGQVTEGDLKALPPAQLEKANRAVTGAGQPPLYTDRPGGAPGAPGGEPVGIESLGGGAGGGGGALTAAAGGKANPSSKWPQARGQGARRTSGSPISARAWKAPRRRARSCPAPCRLSAVCRRNRNSKGLINY